MTGWQSLQEHSVALELALLVFILLEKSRVFADDTIGTRAGHHTDILVHF